MNQKERNMSKAEELLAQAYNMSVVEEKHREAIELCRQALTIEPNNYRVLVFLGMLLGDHGSGEEIAEARKCFTSAIETAESAAYFCTTWPEEAAIHHLGVWEWSQGHYVDATVFFLVDKYLCGNKESSEYLSELLAENEVPVARDLELILRRIMEEYKIVPRDS